MTELRVVLENVRSGETLDLDAVSQDGSGVQAVSGATGFGLPPVEVQWFEGAGDGAEYRGYRVAPRDLDIPLYVAAENRADLKTLLATLSRVIAGQFVLKLYEDDTLYRSITVSRVGGGTYTYGVDSTGENDWQSLITIRAGKPFWLHPTTTSISREYVEGDQDNVIIMNEGSADAFPVWTFHGPLTEVEILLYPDSDFDGRPDAGFTWIGRLNAGETLVIDTQAATVLIDGTTNAYGGLSVAPDLFRLVPGANNIGITVTTPVSAVRTNYVTNPTFGNTTHGWTAGANTSAYVDTGKLHADAVDVSPLPSISKVIGGFSAHAGEVFEVRLTLSTEATAGTVSAPYATYIDVDGHIASYFWSGPAGPDPVFENSIIHSFTVPPSGEVTISIYGAGSTGSPPSWPAIVDEVYVGLPGSYFDGGTTDTVDVTYAWTGTADASTSTATTGALDPDIGVEFRQRDWMVV